MGTTRVAAMTLIVERKPEFDRYLVQVGEANRGLARICFVGNATARYAQTFGWHAEGNTTGGKKVLSVSSVKQ